jgi:hypothetical protein
MIDFDSNLLYIISVIWHKANLANVDYKKINIAMKEPTQGFLNVNILQDPGKELDDGCHGYACD